MMTQSHSANHKDASSCTCYQCGLPVPEGLDIKLEVLGETRYFCCYGCHAVAKTIVESGNEDYYKFRETPDGSQGPVVPDFLQNLEVYDNPEIQKSFVRSPGEGAQEAFLILEDIRCAACVWLNEQQLRKLPGVLDVHMDYASHQARVRWDPEQIKLSEILATITALGYRAHPFDPVQREKLMEEQKRKSITRILFSLILSMEVMAHAIATYWMGGVQPDGKLAMWEVIGRWTDLAVVTAMLLYSGADFYISAWRDLKNKRLGMDVPVVIGLTTAYLGSVYATIFQVHEVYFDSIAMFIVLILGSRYFELQGRLAAAASLDRLLKVVPKTVWRIQADNDQQALTSQEKEEVLVTELAVGDYVLIEPGETVPTDGALVSKESSFDESLLTGEVLPVVRKQGEQVVGGSCNVEQAVVLRVSAPASHSTLTDIRNLLDQGVSSRPHYAQLAERSAKWFVAAILLIAAVTAGVWWRIDPDKVLPVTVSVLIVTCPCALALATPVALSLSSGLFAKMGVLPLKMAAIEPLSQADTVMFDKTGTLTKGHPEVESVFVVAEGADKQKLIEIATALEAASEHPIARAIRQLAQPNLKVSERKNTPGKGVQGIVEGAQWCLGNEDFCVKSDTLSASVSEQLAQARTAGGIVVYLTREGVLQAVFILCDRLRDDAAATVRTLKQQGIKQVVILSGDHPDSVASVAEQVGADAHFGHQKPADKLAFIQQQQQQGHKVIMVGDGINDAPTLAAADVSISFAEATDLAQLSSDFVLMGSHLHTLVKMRRLAARTRKIIIENLTWALGYNFLAVPFAAFGFIPPWGAALGMSLSSFVVVGNALRLKRFEKQLEEPHEQPDPKT